MNLFTREPETLDDYVPRFSNDEVLFNCKSELVQIGGGFKDMDFDPENIEYLNRYTISICGVELRTDRPSYTSDSMYDIVTTMVNDFTSDKANKHKHPAAWDYVTKNAEELNNSKRYWLAMEHRARVDERKAKLADLQEEIRRAGWVASMYAAEVKSGTTLTKEQKLLLLAEFSGGEYKELP